LRTAKTRGCVSRTGILSMVFKLMKSAEARWRALRGPELIAKVITNVQFKDGIEMRNQGSQKVTARSPRRTQHLTIAPHTVRMELASNRKECPHLEGGPP
jgi:hypothetical protein